MNIEELTDELYEILACETEEPAGHDCGYGVTEEGQKQIEELLKPLFAIETPTERERIMSTETMNEVTIDVVNEVFDTTQNRVVKTTRKQVFNGRLGGTTPLVSVLKAYETVRTKGNVKDNLNNLEVRVNNSPFPG